MRLFGYIAITLRVCSRVKLPYHMVGQPFTRTISNAARTIKEGPRKTLRILVREYERLIVTQTLSRNGDNRRRTAEALGISLRGLEKILARHGLSARRKQA